MAVLKWEFPNPLYVRTVLGGISAASTLKANQLNRLSADNQRHLVWQTLCEQLDTLNELAPYADDLSGNRVFKRDLQWLFRLSDYRIGRAFPVSQLNSVDRQKAWLYTEAVQCLEMTCLGVFNAANPVGPVRRGAPPGPTIADLQEESYALHMELQQREADALTRREAAQRIQLDSAERR